jgi:hypothetical protein
MLRCNQCGQYYVPGFLDCQCRAVSLTARAKDAEARAPLNLSAPQPKLLLPAPEVTARPDSPGPLERQVRGQPIRF